MTPDAFSRSTGATLPDWLSGVGDAPPNAPLLGLPDLDDDIAPPTERLTRTPPPAPRPAGRWELARRKVAHAPADADHARTFRFEIKNPSATEHREYKVEFGLPPGAAAAVTQKAARTRRGLEWDLGVLPPGGTVVLAVRLTLDDTTAVFRTAPAAVQVAHRAVPEARLDVTADVAGVVRAGVPTTASLTVTNDGGRGPTDVRVAVFGTDPHTPLVTETVAGLTAGEARAVAVTLTPGCGRSAFRAVASAAGATTGEATFETLGVEPEAGVRLVLPPAVGADEEVTGRLVVTNRTLLPVAGFRASVTLPDELAFRGATRRGTLSETGDGIEWAVGDLAAGAEWVAELRLVGFSPGRLRLVAAVTADGLAGVSASAPLTCEPRRSAGRGSLAALLEAQPAFDPTEPAVVPPRDTRARHLLFRAADARFALPIGNVREILKPLPLTAVPGVPDWVCGVANVRGDVVTVLDLAPFLGVGEPGPRRALLIVTADGADPVGVLIDELAGLHPVGDGDPPEAGDLARYLAGVTPDPAGPIHRLNPAELLAAAGSQLMSAPRG